MLFVVNAPAQKLHEIFTKSFFKSGTVDVSWPILVVPIGEAAGNGVEVLARWVFEGAAFMAHLF